MDQGAGLVTNVIKTQAKCLRYRITLNDIYKFRIDMRNLFIYPTVAPKMEQRTDLKRTSVHVKPRASLCTATYEAASTVEVWSLCSHRSTCTETMRVSMNNKLSRSGGYTSKPNIKLVLINFTFSNLFHFSLRLFIARNHTVVHIVVSDRPFIWL